MIETAFHHCGDRVSLPVSNLHTTKAAILNERGHDIDALQNFDRARMIREQLLHEEDSEIANALSNCAIAIVGIGEEPNKALEMLLRALSIDESKPEAIKNKVLHLRHLNLCFAYKALKDWQNARYHLERGIQYATAEFGEGSRYMVM